ncbi:MAG: peptide chain release factor N(5)-glutamine methyltransferase, partial [Flavobacteriales bacterium]
FAAKRIAAGEPTQYVIGHAPFMHWDFHVQPGVLIPRPETEELVSWIAERQQNEVARVLDIGVGSGCISIALKKLRPRWEVTGIDRSEAALEVARINANKLETPITLETMDVFEYSRWADWDIIVCNPPYIHADEAKDMAEHVVRHEPHEALFVSGNDPLLFYKHILKACKHQPKPERSIYFELPAQHALQLQDWIHEHIQVNSLLKNDMQDKPRMIYISL